MQNWWRGLVAGFRRWFEWYYGLTKRTDHSRIIFIGLLVSVGSILSPWWMPIVFGVLEKYTSIEFEVDSQPWIGLFVFIVVCIYSYFVFWIDKVLQRDVLNFNVNSDAVVVREVLSIVNPINFRDNILYIDANHIYDNDQWRLIARVIDILEDPAKSIINIELREAANDLRSALVSFREFLAVNFFVFPDHGKEIYTYALYPELNMDRSGVYDEHKYDLYQKYAKELQDMTTIVIDSYNEFFITGRRILGAAMSTAG